MMHNQSQRISNSQNQQPPPRSLSNARPNNNNIIGSHSTQQPLSAYMGTKTPQNNINNDASRIGAKS